MWSEFCKSKKIPFLLENVAVELDMTGATVMGRLCLTFVSSFSCSVGGEVTGGGGGRERWWDVMNECYTYVHVEKIYYCEYRL